MFEETFIGEKRMVDNASQIVIKKEPKDEVLTIVNSSQKKQRSQLGRSARSEQTPEAFDLKITALSRRSE